MSINYNFENFAQSDYQELKEMIFGLYDEDHPNVPVTEKNILNTVRELTQNPSKGQIIMFKTDDIITGYGIVIFFWSNEYGGNILYIDELFVKEEWRNKKIGTKFFDYIYKSFANKVVAMKLEVTPDNIRARKYYERLGFKETRNNHFIKSPV